MLFQFDSYLFCGVIAVGTYAFTMGLGIPRFVKLYPLPFLILWFVMYVRICFADKPVSLQSLSRSVVFAYGHVLCACRYPLRMLFCASVKFVLGFRSVPLLDVGMAFAESVVIGLAVVVILCAWIDSTAFTSVIIRMSSGFKVSPTARLAQLRTFACIRGSSRDDFVCFTAAIFGVPDLGIGALTVKKLDDSAGISR